MYEINYKVSGPDKGKYLNDIPLLLKNPVHKFKKERERERATA
jgi:hypothetical protein